MTYIFLMHQDEAFLATRIARTLRRQHRLDELAYILHIRRGEVG